MGETKKPLSITIKLASSYEFAGAYVLVCEYSGYEIELMYDRDGLIQLRNSIASLMEQHPLPEYTLDGWEGWLNIFSEQLGIKPVVEQKELEMDELSASSKRVYAFRKSIEPKNFAESILSSPSWFLDEYGNASKVGTFYECLDQYRKYTPEILPPLDDSDLQDALTYGRCILGGDEFMKIVFHPEFVQNTLKP